MKNIAPMKNKKSRIHSESYTTGLSRSGAARELQQGRRMARANKAKSLSIHN